MLAYAHKDNDSKELTSFSNQMRWNDLLFVEIERECGYDLEGIKTKLQRLCVSKHQLHLHQFASNQAWL